MHTCMLMVSSAHRFTILCRTSYFIAIVAVDNCCFWLKCSSVYSSIRSVATVGYLPKCNFQFNGIFTRCREIYYCKCRGTGSSRCTPSPCFCSRFSCVRLQEPSIHIHCNEIIVGYRLRKKSMEKRKSRQAEGATHFNAFCKMTQFSIVFLPLLYRIVCATASTFVQFLQHTIVPHAAT